MKKINCILLVDDNPADNEFHKIIIKESNICDQVRVATNGKKALEYIVKSGELENSQEFPKPDLIYLDINMPGMNGFEFLEEYHKLNEKLKSKILIIMLTTSLNPDDQQRTMEIKEVSNFQNKPLTVEMLQTVAKNYF